MSLLARLPAGESSGEQVAVLLEHFREHRGLARSLLRGTALRVVRNVLVGHVDASLKRNGARRLLLPRRLAAHALADRMLSPVFARLSGEAECSRLIVAAALGIVSEATLGGMVAVSDRTRNWDPC